MKVTLLTHGGFAPALRPRPMTVDSDALAAGDADELARLVESVRASAPEADAGPGLARDAFTYTIAVEDAGDTQTFSFSDADPSSDLAALRDWFQRRALKS
ncbi:MAG TPA: protealysin inhibitor emfourin [Polyangia bacterium]